MKVDVLDIAGKKTGEKVELPKSVFEIEPSKHAIYLDVKRYLAHQRTGTHSTKERWAIVGSTRKIKKQKGTGTARAGSIKNPLFVGGGRVFGPKPRLYTQNLNKKQKQLARKSALSLKLKEKSVIVLDKISFDSPKTKNFKNVLSALEIDTEKVLLLMNDVNRNVYLSARNVKSANVVVSSNVTTYEILNSKKVVLLKDAIGQLNEVLN